MTEQTTIRQSPLYGEHILPMLVDFGALVFAMVVLTVLGVPNNGLLALIVLPFGVLVHVVQLAWLVALRFDDTAITIVRPWRRRRVEWSRIAGLVYTSDSSRIYRLRLVLRGDETSTKGPVIVTTHPDEIEPALGRTPGRGTRCVRQILAELTRRGFPPPPTVPGRFQPAAREETS